MRLFNDWRESRSGKSSIPETLLDAAYEILETASLSTLSRILRLSRTRLAQAFEMRRELGAKTIQQRQRPARRVQGTVPSAAAPASAGVHVTQDVELHCYLAHYLRPILTNTFSSGLKRRLLLVTIKISVLRPIAITVPQLLLQNVGAIPV